MDIFLLLHSYVRWLIILVAVIAVVKFAIGWLKKQPYGPLDQRLQMSFSILMDVQMTLGLIYLIWSGMAGVGFPMYRIEHAITLFVAVVVGHLPAAWKKAPDATRFRNTLFAILGALVLVFLGIMSLPGNRWHF